ncbi:hypothetical protein [Pseudohongiella sp.]|uniref:Uncharacterized protein n=3 Tax=root TaxID=1 RepID=A0A0F9Y4Y6_9ZZZZ|nr:hypothetical protein [Pseudohongiella sp.]HDZ10218.1 hypothetical protein [Pseudohongiella sp.]
MTLFLPGQEQRTRVASAIAALLATAFVVLAITGTARMYTPVPYWDMWSATLGFYMAVNDGASWLWWAQHNEHRIVLSRLLFWLDYEIFGGKSIFLLVMNYVIVAMAVVLFWRISRAQLAHLSDPARRNTVFFTTCFLVAWLYQWMQQENLAWAFQSQFFLAQLLPLCAFYVLHKSALNDKAQLTFVAACLLGITSAGTMANGILALPLMVAYALIARMRWWQIVSLLLLTALTLTLYFYDYSSPTSHGSVLDALFQQPLELAQYVLLYLGSPFFYLFGEGDIGRVAAVVATTIMAAVALTMLFRSIREPGPHALPLALVFGIIYLSGTALGTGGGRLIFGVYQAVSYRYTTPAIMAWACLFILVLPWLQHHMRRAPRRCAVVMAILLALMLRGQMDALLPQQQLVFDRNIAGLALELDIRDEAQIGKIYELSDGLMRTAEVASQRNLSIFGAQPWQDLRESLGQITIPAVANQCAGHIDAVIAIAPNDTFVAVQGWLFNPAADKAPELITMTDVSGEISGYALTGQPRPDVAQAIDSDAKLSGFRGYVRKELLGSAVMLIGDQTQCELLTELPQQN